MQQAQIEELQEQIDLLNKGMRNILRSIAELYDRVEALEGEEHAIT